MPEAGEGVVEMPLVTEAEESWEASQSHSHRATAFLGKGGLLQDGARFMPVLCSLLPVLRPQSIVGHPEAQSVNFDSHTGSSDCTGCSVFPQQGPALDSKLFFVVVVFCIRESHFLHCPQRVGEGCWRLLAI